jgi:hypothetical protein
MVFFVLCRFLNSISEGSYFIYTLLLLCILHFRPDFLARYMFLIFLSIRKRGLTLHLYYKVLTGGAEIKVHVGFVAIHKEKYKVLPGYTEIEVHDGITWWC